MSEESLKGCFILSIIGMFVLLCIVCSGIFGGIAQDYSDGMRTGDIYKFSKKGLIWKSWEGEMYIGGYHLASGKNPTIATDKFDFSIPESEEDSKKDIIEGIQKCVETRKTCSISYKEWFIGPANVEDSHIVTGVKIEE